jgi:hypothetical protein
MLVIFNKVFRSGQVLFYFFISIFIIISDFRDQVVEGSCLLPLKSTSASSILCCCSEDSCLFAPGGLLRFVLPCEKVYAV